MESSDEAIELAALDAQLNTLLPLQYQGCYDDVEPVSMGSAGLKYDAAGRVAWDEIWGSFCDLAMAGGPPHKGKLLEPGSADAIAADPAAYRQVVGEICRGIRMVADSVAVEPSATPGWVRVLCRIPGMAGWLARAITMENVAACAGEDWVELPAGPAYRVEKEIKNVITVVAKTCHYFAEHMATGQQKRIAALFAEATTPLVQPALRGRGFDAAAVDAAAEELAGRIGALTGLRPAEARYAGWLGLECSSVRVAIWMMRALAVHNVLARREETRLFVPVHPVLDSDGTLVAGAVARVWRLANARGI